MSFSLAAAGRVDDVRAQLHHQLELHKKWGENLQEAAVVELLEQHLGASAFPGGVFVEANGHQDAAVASLTITLRSLYMPHAEHVAAPGDADTKA